MNKILVIEDDEVLSQALKTKLISEGFEVVTAFDGQSGLDLALSQLPKAILLDLILPKLDGISILKQLKKNNITRDIPVIVLSNIDTEEVIKEAWDTGIYAYLVKADSRLDDIINRVKMALKIIG